MPQTLTLADVAVEVPGVDVVRVNGSSRLLEERGIGICGSRDVTERGVEIAREVGVLAAEAGLLLIAGDARGVDEAAQTAALEAGGSVVAVLPEGLEHWRPRSSYRHLFDEESGTFAAVSQFGDRDRWQVFRAMARNKLVIRLSSVLFVVEAGAKGGTWEAGRQALAWKHPLYVLGDEEDSLTDGSRALIARGGHFLQPDGVSKLLRSIAEGRFVRPEQGRLAV